MTAPGFSHLPDFSKGEDHIRPRGQEFKPLFGQPADQQIWVDQSDIQPVNEDDDLARLASELDQLQGGPALQEEVSEPAIVLVEDQVDGLDDLRVQHAAELEQMEAAHNNEIMSQLQDLQSGLIDQVADKLEFMLVQSLEQLLQQRLSSASIEQLVSDIKHAIKTEAIDRIKLSGPANLTNAVSTALAGGTCQIDVEQSDSTDLVVRLNEQILSTRIGDWAKKIDKALNR